MARPKPEILLEHINQLDYKAEQILNANGIYAVCYNGEPINIRSIHTLVSHPGPKYKKCNFSNPGGAIGLAKRLNKLFKTDAFKVHELTPGPVYVKA